MARSGVRLNSRQIQSYLDGDHGVAGLLRERAGRVLAKAQDIAPVDTGAYRDSLHIEETNTDRLVVRVVAGDRKAPLVEAQFGVLARSLDAAG